MESLMHSRTRDLLTRSWQSQANLSLFLVLLNSSRVRSPFGRPREEWFATLRRHCVFRRISRWGCDRLGEPKTVRADIAGVYRGDCMAVDDLVEANEPA